jgi:hypothetical protein
MYALSVGAKSEELVTPHIAPAVSIAVSGPGEEMRVGGNGMGTGMGMMDWTKKRVVVAKDVSGDGLGALLNAK